MHDRSYMTSALPDPDQRPEFYAGVAPKRAMAWVIDMILSAIIAAIVVPFTFFIAIFFFPFLMLTVNLVLRWVTLAIWGATPGMCLMALEMRNSDGAHPDAMTAFLHASGSTVVFSIFPLHLVSMGLILVDDRRQGLVDKALQTVIHNRAYQPA
ncbi:RDD family protein [Yoonia sp. 208BN28-4]|uniref:RDD family protein n=1 Tax=Yoonia sp. 208BN28-4 TaxID=3126505 RepID=UPI0030A4366D